MESGVTTKEAQKLAADLRGTKAADIAQATIDRGPDHIKAALFALAGLAVANSDATTAPKNPAQEAIVAALKKSGADIISPEVYKEIGLEFNPVNSITEEDVRLVQSLPKHLRSLVAFVPVKGDFSAHQLGSLLNDKATEKGFGDVAYLDSDSEKLGKTRKGDRWVMILKEALPDSTSLNRDQQAKLIPVGFEWINPAEAYSAVALKRFATENADAYFKGPWVRTSSPRSVVSGYYLSRADADDYALDDQFDNIGAGVSRISN